MHRHQYRGRKLSRKSGPRKALIRGLASQVILYEKVTTTLEKAKEVQPVVEKLITRAKSGSLHDRRMALKVLPSNDLSLVKLFEELGPLYKDRNGGYTRIIKVENRAGDNARMAVIELLDTEKLTKKVMAEKKSAGKSEKEATKVEKKDAKTATKKEAPKKTASKGKAK
jgi:large subunit ribosomal protein L17